MDISEIARRAKVSTATVSRAINRVPTVDHQLAKRVWKVVDELGYFPNTQARALVTQRSTELDAKRHLIENGTMPKLELVNLESQLKIAEAALSAAEAERDFAVFPHAAAALRQ